jgi:xylulokinase
VILIGGAARSEAVRRIAPQIFGVPVTVPSAAEYVALGAARQAAWALSGASEPPTWPLAGTTREFTAEPTPEVHAQYAALRDATAGWA